jgi:hypothetical protein
MKLPSNEAFNADDAVGFFNSARGDLFRDVVIFHWKLHSGSPQVIALAGMAYKTALEISPSQCDRFCDLVNQRLFADFDFWRSGFTTDAMEAIFSVANQLDLPKSPYKMKNAYKKRKTFPCYFAFMIAMTNFAFTMSVNDKFRGFLLKGAV